jgi:hypothetical protein
MRSIMPLAVLLVVIFVPATGRSETPVALKSITLDLPSNETLFPGPGNDAINTNCLTCHSAEMVLTQPPMSRAKWQAVVDKMIRAYKAPVAAEDVAAIVDYLARTKGGK